MTKTIQQTIEKFDLPSKVVVACSGGLDSTVLLESLVRFRPDLNISVAHVNYHLRTDADADADFVRATAADHGLDFYEKIVDLSNERNGVEEKARDIRYAFFQEVAQKSNAEGIVLAQHKNDQAETILLQIIRGGANQQKAGMHARSGEYYRPFLDLSKAELLAYAKKNKLDWHEDITNLDPDYTPRNKIRNEVLPALEEINGHAVDHLVQWAKGAQKEQAFLSESVKADLAMFKTDYRQIKVDWWPFFLKELAKDAGLYQLKEDQVDAFCHLLENDRKPNGAVALSQGYSFFKSYDRVSVRKSPSNPEKSGKNLLKAGQKKRRLVLELDQWYFLADLMLAVQNKEQVKQSGSVLTLPADLNGPLTIEQADENSEVPIKGGHKSVRRLLIDQKISQEVRSETYLLLDRTENVLAVWLGKERWYKSANWPADRPSGKQCLVWRIEGN
ncbi:tRNA lysidine(34) synthetase TilS [Fructobacillus sp. M2-14]|uniref:tRNA(Ile)-lysidine synthase n=1 Tax=Fructobacillus broussonetiae TaxID=2713173 RepID=A0ABS5R0K7_9LACO|nr:tRNA lysidine(34) synthetase TilS [Fructobacillus broussonetiae]MBS9338978.1 tRNA lysidine(34) synthetase TilS [Fructobacillus broussonetiae]